MYDPNWSKLLLADFGHLIEINENKTLNQKLPVSAKYRIKYRAHEWKTFIEIKRNRTQTPKLKKRFTMIFKMKTYKHDLTVSITKLSRFDHKFSKIAFFIYC